MRTANSDFPTKVWDGLSLGYINLNDDKNPDFYWADKVTQEIVAIESWLLGDTSSFVLQDSAFEGDVISNLGQLASSITGKTVLGLADENILIGTQGRIKHNGIKTLDNWFRVTGGLKLESGKTYYLSNIAGKLTTAIPETGWLVRVGYAITETELFINIQDGIKL